MLPPLLWMAFSPVSDKSHSFSPHAQFGFNRARTREQREIGGTGGKPPRPPAPSDEQLFELWCLLGRVTARLPTATPWLSAATW